MIIWGGWGDAGETQIGGRYNPALDSWTLTSSAGAPYSRDHYSAVWTGIEMIIWGGWGSTLHNDGAKYNPSTNSWTLITLTNSPAARENHSAIWTGTSMIIWGGHDGTSFLGTGASYNPANDTWSSISANYAPSARAGHRAVWTGSEMIVWGGSDSNNKLNTGGKYRLSNNTWYPMSTSIAPVARIDFTAEWTGNEMIVWGGTDEYDDFDTGGRYYPNTDTWLATSTNKAPFARNKHTSIWTGTNMIIWGGYYYTGGRYCSYCPHTFDDVPCRFWAFDYIETLSSHGVTNGCHLNPPLFCPDSNVKRDEMAVFLIKSMGQTPAGSCTGIFNDVPVNYWACPFIEKLYTLGITAGCTSALYCPLGNVHRDEIAVFIIKAMNETPVSSCAGVFLDVPPSYWACKYIERLVQLNITSGCLPNYYCPSSNISRAQMAKFLVLAFNL